MINKKYEIRKIIRSDQKFIKEMLYQAIYTPPEEERPPRSILEEVKLKKYYSDFGNINDLGYIAIDKDTKKAVGAIWLRLFKKENKGWGYISEDIPELSMAVDTIYRGKGIGKLLLNHILENSIKIYPNISLSVDLENYAKKIYEEFGFKESYIEGTSMTMLLKRKNI